MEVYLKPIFLFQCTARKIFYDMNSSFQIAFTGIRVSSTLTLKGEYRNIVFLYDQHLAQLWVTPHLN